MKPCAVIHLRHLVPLAVLAAACDVADISPPASPVARVSFGLAESPNDADDADPFVRAVAEVTGLFSEAGIQIRDSEWWPLQQGILASRLEPARFRKALDALFLVAPFPAIYPDVRLPRELHVRGRFVTARLSQRAGRDPRWVLAEPVAIYALPETIRWMVNRVAHGTPGSIIHIEARVLREPSDDAPVAAEITVAWSDCGWCSEGKVFTIDTEGVLIDERFDQSWAADGYCC
jgi:hypothetical protein